MNVSNDIFYKALLERDPAFDGKFFVCVKTTGIFCRSICPARKPHQHNCDFALTREEAEAKGFRACKRCRPETAPGSPAWKGTGATVSRALKVLSQQTGDGLTIANLASSCGMGERHLRRLFHDHLGVSPKALLQERRLNLARQMLTQETTPISRVAFLSGYSSIRRFNDAFKNEFGMTPTKFRETHQKNKDQK
ncbi:MAG: Ada metal-binding domain-containing protein [Sphingomonadales bacterium]